ncbi:MAG: trimethylamine methyltransferase family protein [Pseudomonadota bacterium]
MTVMEKPTRKGRRRANHGATSAGGGHAKQVNYRQIKNPFPHHRVVSDDQLHHIHATALRVLSDLGIRVLLPEARQLFRSAGAKVDEDTLMVHFDPTMVEENVDRAPRSFTVHAGDPTRNLDVQLGTLLFQPGGAAPHATDLTRGRRPATLSDFRDLCKLTQAFDVLHMFSALVEPQDVPTHVRHYEQMRGQLTLSDKVPHVYGRGSPQVRDSFELIKIIRGLSDDDFRACPWTYTVVNTNSPRQLDIPMAQALIDFARAGQASIVTPFTLMGAMAPITVAGAMTLSHAEALAGIALTQIAHPGAPVMYGTFTSNVDMKSGAPAFGTPEHFKASALAGQLARHLGLPWRCASGSAANLGDAQAASETQMGMWGCVLGGATLVKHAAGWLEGGLTVSYEKLVTDVEVLQMVADLCHHTAADEDEIGFDAIAEVEPGGHFFAAGQTMQRYQTEFYEPMVHDWANFGTWTERGSHDATARATEVWQKIVAEQTPPTVPHDRLEAFDAFVARRTEEGGAPPES